MAKKRKKWVEYEFEMSTEGHKFKIKIDFTSFRKIESFKKGLKKSKDWFWIDKNGCKSEKGPKWLQKIFLIVKKCSKGIKKVQKVFEKSSKKSQKDSNMAFVFWA